MIEAQKAADRGYKKFLNSNLGFSWKFRLLEAETLLWEGMSDQVLALLDSAAPPPDSPEFLIPDLTLRSLAYTRQHNFPGSETNLAKAETLCASQNEMSCGGVFRARGVLALEQGDVPAAGKAFQKSLAFGRVHNDQFLEATALLNLGTASLHDNRYDDSIEWSKSAQRLSTAIDAKDITQFAVGNLGWAYYKLGDSENALASFAAAEKSAEQLDDKLAQVIWLTDIGSVDLDRADYQNAEQVFNKALSLARQLGAKEYIRNALIPLALVYERRGKFDLANQYSDEAIAEARVDGNRLDELYPLLVKGQVAAQLHDSAHAAAIFREVAADPQSDSSLKWEAQHSLARLEEDGGQREAAGREYEAALCTFETERSSVQHEESRLPFFTNAARIYDDYVAFLIKSGQQARALEVAEFSRGRTLAEGLGLLPNERPCATPALDAERVAGNAKATILYYWLGQQQSYLWAISSKGVQSFPLPAAAQIDASVRRYGEAVVNGEDVIANSNQDGLQLYQTLIAPAASRLPKVSRVVVVADGSLSSLNFETLLVPGTAQPHYWIEDAVLSNAQSLRLLAAKKITTQGGVENVLLIGDAVPHNPEYPALPNAKLEIENVGKHFAPAALTTFTQSAATASAFLESRPEQYSYIHFVAHAVAISQVPLDSAVILSPQSGDDSFKLYARDIVQHHLRARLVTVSACYGAGTRSYSGEGLIGLSWAFLRAGALNTIGALWEVNDASTPQLMDLFYAELEQGRAPNVALRDSKLALMRSNKSFSKPFYWAPFQLYGTS